MSQNNLYAPPKSNVAEIRGTKCSRDGKIAVVHAGNDLPPRCITCNDPAKEPTKEVKLYWHSPWLYLLILINPVIYLLVAILARRSVKVSPGLCETHVSKRNRRLLVIFGLCAGAAVIGIAQQFAAKPDGALAFYLLAAVLLIVALFATRKIYAKKITKEYARVGGCKEPFLASLE